MARLITATAVFLSLCVGSVCADVYFVDAVGGSNKKSGENEWANAKKTIQAAMGKAKTGDTILVKYDPTSTVGTIYTINSAINFNGKDIKLISDCGKHETYESAEPNATLCIIDAQQNDRVFIFKSGETNASVVRGFTIKNGQAPASDLPAYQGIGSGILCDNSSPTIKDNIIEKNGPGNAWTNPKGFGIACIESSNPTIEGNKIQDNYAKSGAGTNPDNGTGGGIYCDSSSPIIRHNTIINNDINVITTNGGKAGKGGGIACHMNSCPKIERNIINNNYAGYQGGGIFFADCKTKIVMVNNLICSNMAHGGAGGVFCISSSVSIINNTIASNANYGGGSTGIQFEKTGSADIVNTIVWENKPKIGKYQISVPGGYTGTIDHCTYDAGTWGVGSLPSGFNLGANNHPGDPLFVSNTDDFYLQDNSPCIDKGTKSPPSVIFPPTDIQGIPRSLDGDGVGGALPDIGAYEKADTDVSIWPWETPSSVTTFAIPNWTSFDIWVEKIRKLSDPTKSNPQPDGSNARIVIGQKYRIFARFRLTSNALAAYHVEAKFYMAENVGAMNYNTNPADFTRICGKTHVVETVDVKDINPQDGRVDELPGKRGYATVYIDWTPVGGSIHRCIAVVIDPANRDLNPANHIAQENLKVEQAPTPPPPPPIWPDPNVPFGYETSAEFVNPIPEQETTLTLHAEGVFPESWTSGEFTPGVTLEPDMLEMQMGELSRRARAFVTIPPTAEVGDRAIISFWYETVPSRDEEEIIRGGFSTILEIGDFVVVDDFEGYNNDTNRIFETWIDGWGNSTNGSTVGYPRPHFAAGEHFIETWIIHGGSQSMPYFYDNHLRYSEATRTLDYPCNWTEQGFEVLSLWFCGDTAFNDPAPMYVTLTDNAGKSAVVYHDNPNAALVNSWTEWPINLMQFAQLGIDLMDVDRLSIGFGDRENPQFGGSGLMYFDDIVLVRSPQESAAEQITVIGWNAESGDANPNVIADRIEEIYGCDIWGICEVLDSNWATTFEQAAEVDENADFQQLLGSTGGSDKMLIIYDADRFTLVDDYELHRINLGGYVRAPLVAHFRITGTDIEFLFMVNHLYRSSSYLRHEQARLLNLWASQQALPIIAVGDYSFDWQVWEGDQLHDEGYDAMVRDGHFNWIRPNKLKKTQANPSYNSILDFVFLGGDCWTWTAETTILQRDANDTDDDSFPDDDQTTDHRPVRAKIKIE